MRIIAGKYRGRKLKSPPSLATRPTSDRLRETLFNILAPRIEGARFLDLCAGTGAVGIEALSRGAEHITFVDQSRKMCALIEANVHGLKIDEKDFQVVVSEALAYLKKRRSKSTPSLTVGLPPRVVEPFNIVFFDPPYAADYESVIGYVGDHSELLADDAVMIVEHHKKKELAERFGELKRHRGVKQGDSHLSLYTRSAV